LELGLVPSDAGILVGVRIGITRSRAGVAAVEPVELRATLFLAPSPTAWQAMHLLNEVLPAATSCAIAADAAIDDAMTTSALSVSLYHVCSSWFRGWLGGRCCKVRSRWTARQNTS